MVLSNSITGRTGVYRLRTGSCASCRNRCSLANRLICCRENEFKVFFRGSETWSKLTESKRWDFSCNNGVCWKGKLVFLGNSLPARWYRHTGSLLPGQLSCIRNRSAHKINISPEYRVTINKAKQINLMYDDESLSSVILEVLIQYKYYIQLCRESLKWHVDWKTCMWLRPYANH